MLAIRRAVTIKPSEWFLNKEYGLFRLRDAVVLNFPGAVSESPEAETEEVLHDSGLSISICH